MNTSISRYALSIFSILILFAALVVTSGMAATRSRSVTVQIPFDFTVAGKSLPAGRYLVERSTLSSAEGISLRSVDKQSGVFVLTSTVRSEWRQKESRLVFNRYHDQYFLSEVWTSGEATGRELIKSAKERALAEEVAKAGAKPERIALTVPQR
jgi:hypothetical protein